MCLIQVIVSAFLFFHSKPAQALLQEAVFAKITERIQVYRDPKDDKFIELAVSAKAVCIVSSDEDLLVLNPFRDIPILTPDEFLKRQCDEGSD